MLKINKLVNIIYRVIYPKFNNTRLIILNTNLLHNLNGSFKEIEDTMDLLKILPGEIAYIERSLIPALNEDSNEVANARHSLKLIRLSLTLITDKTKREIAEDTNTLHEIFDIFESHRLIPYSKVID